jgi:hypothetical protein
MILVEETRTKYGYDINGLRPNSNKMCIYQCDYCGNKEEKSLDKIQRGRKVVEKDCCKACTSKKVAEVNLFKYGVKTALERKECLEKAKKTTLERHGGTNVFSLELIKQKIKKTNLERYGAENPQQNHSIREKTRKTNQERYGSDFPLQNPDINNKQTKTMVERYGVQYYAQTDAFKKEYAEINKLSYETIVERCLIKNYKPLFTKEQYKHVKDTMTFFCDVHKKPFESNVFLVSFNNEKHRNQCPDCKLNGISIAEQQIFDFVSSLLPPETKYMRNSRQIIKPYEIDIFVPEKKVGIEHHGLMWHSKKFNNDNKLHYKKFQLAQELGIKLFQFYEDEWEYKQDICKSIIANSLNCTTEFIGARDLVLCADIDIDDFFSQNHLQGSSQRAGLKKSFALTDKDGLIYSAMLLHNSFGKSGVIEIVRFASRKNVVISGAFSRLLKYAILWAKANSYARIITHSDNRLSQGNLYKLNGFSLQNASGPSYDYTDCNVRYPRYPFRTTLSQTERQITEGFGLYKLYNAGTRTWSLDI